MMRRPAFDTPHIELHELQPALGGGGHTEAQKYRAEASGVGRRSPNLPLFL